MAVNPEIKKMTDEIRNQPDADKVRTNIANGMDATSDIADLSNKISEGSKATVLAIQKRYEEQLLAQDLNPNKDPELVDLRGGKATAGERMTELEQSTTAQFQQIENEKASINYVDAILMDIAKGGPKGLFNSLVTLTSKYPNGAEGTFLVMDSSFTNGAHSFMWDTFNSTWKDLGVYQATGLSKNSVSYEETDFLELDLSINMFNGIYEKGLNINGASGSLTLGKVYDGKVAIFDVEPNKSYSVHAKSTGEMLFKIATSSIFVEDGGSFDGIINFGYGDYKIPKIYTTGPNDKYLYVQTRPNDSTIPFLKVVKSTTVVPISEKEEYPIKPKNVSLYGKKEVDDLVNNINPSQTTFLEVYNDNVFDGQWVEGKNLLGNADTLSSSPLSHVLISDIEPNTTYTINKGLTEPESGYYYFKLATSSKTKEELVNSTTDVQMDGLKYGNTSTHTSRYEFTTKLTDKTLVVLVSKSAYPYVEVVKGKHSGFYYENYIDRKYTFFKDLIVGNNSISGGSKKWVWFGDSISQLRQLPHLVGEFLNDDIYDVSLAGATLCKHHYWVYEDMSVLKLSEYIKENNFTKLDATLAQQQSGGADITAKLINVNILKGLVWSKIDNAVIFAGTNDFASAVSTLAEFKAGVVQIITNLLAKKPDLQLYFITPMYRSGHNVPNAQGLVLKDYVDAIIETANEYGYPVFDLFNGSGINFLNQSTYLITDLLHQNEKGDVLLAEKNARFLSSH